VRRVAVVGAILDLDEAGEWVAAGKVDLVAVCRGLLADSAMPKKTFRGRKDEVIPCIRCNVCLLRGAHGPADALYGQSAERAGELLPLASPDGACEEESRRRGWRAGRLGDRDNGGGARTRRHPLREGRPAGRQPSDVVGAGLQG